MISIDINKALIGSSGAMSLSVNLKIKEHDFVAISGESGSGKTTLLRIVAGLEQAKGEIIVGSQVWQDEQTNLAIQERDIGFVFQDYALFENMSVEQNLLFVKKDKFLSSKLLELTHLTGLKDSTVTTLSGGQKQRVALCRALMNQPKILLMDEPLSALDPSMRTKLQQDILVLHQEFGTTTLMISHDPSEIYRLSQRVITLHNGVIIEDGVPKDILLKTQGSQKFSLLGEILEIIKADVIHIAVVAIGVQIVEVVIDHEESKQFCVGDQVIISTKAFAPTLSKIRS
jgi:molybdate transport system ATP-binding protein